jgi:hypothetical protein
MVIGMPGETRETVIESAKFIASLRYSLEMNWNIREESFSWAMAIPGTPLYEYCQQIGVIGKTLDEEEDYLIRSADHVLNFLNYVNKTDSSIKEVHYWQYLYHYAAKKTYLGLIIKNNKSIKNRLLQIYEQCIKPTFVDLITLYKQKKGLNEKLLQKMKSYLRISIDFLLSLSTVFLPKVILFPIVRVYANLRFYSLEKNHKVKVGKQKHNVFTSKPIDSTNEFRLTKNKIAKANKQIDLSLRKVVKENRKKMKPAVTDEEIGLQILAQGQ